MAKSKRPRRGYFSAVWGCWCPRCREGKLFTHRTTIKVKKNLDMYERCTVCGQVTDIEVGFYYGTGYISYLLGIFFTVITFLLWFLLVGFSFGDNRFAAWLIVNSVSLLLLQPWLMRFSRSLWLAFFVPYEPDWEHVAPLEPERTNEQQRNNW